MTSKVTSQRLFVVQVKWFACFDSILLDLVWFVSCVVGVVVEAFFLSTRVS